MFSQTGGFKKASGVDQLSGAAQGSAEAGESWPFGKAISGR
jgi:hypothetical protein